MGATFAVTTALASLIDPPRFQANYDTALLTERAGADYTLVAAF
jgi:hypothetical protein